MLDLSQEALNNTITLARECTSKHRRFRLSHLSTVGTENVESSFENLHHKKAIAIKEYSNKFLREARTNVAVIAVERKQLKTTLSKGHITSHQTKRQDKQNRYSMTDTKPGDESKISKSRALELYSRLIKSNHQFATYKRRRLHVKQVSFQVTKIQLKDKSERHSSVLPSRQRPRMETVKEARFKKRLEQQNFKIKPWQTFTDDEY